MRSKLKITAINLFAAILTSIFLAVSIGYFLILEPLAGMKGNVEQAQQNYTEQQKQLVKDNVDFVVEHIRSRRQLHLEHVRLEMEEKLSTVQRLAASLDRLNISRSEKQQALAGSLFETNWTHGAGSYLLVNPADQIIYADHDTDCRLYAC